MSKRPPPFAERPSPSNQVLEKAILAFPPAFIELGGQLGKLGRFDEGVAVLESGLALTPDVVDLRMGLGYLHVKRNERAKARALFSQVLAAASARHDALLALAKVMALD